MTKPPVKRTPTPTQSRCKGQIHREVLTFTKRLNFDYTGELEFADRHDGGYYTLPVELKPEQYGWREPTGFLYDKDTGLPRVTKRKNDMRLKLETVCLIQNDKD